MLPLLVVAVGCERQKFKPASWDAAPKVEGSVLDDFDGEKKPNAKIPPLPEVTDWMSPDSPRRVILGGPYRGNVSPYRGKVSPYRGNVSPYRGNASPYRGSTVPYAGDVRTRNGAAAYRGNTGQSSAAQIPARGYGNPLRPSASNRNQAYQGNQSSGGQQYGGWRSPSQSYRGNQRPAQRGSYPGAYRGNR